MRHLEGQTSTADGLALYTQTWLPDEEPKGMLAFSHGGGEHSGRYHHVGAALAKAGYGLHMVDLRGHGKSPGRRGHLMAWDEYRRDMAALMEGARQTATQVPQFFGGHSLGGLIAASVAVDNPSGYKGVVLSGAFLEMAWQPAPSKLAMARLLARFLPGVTTTNDLDPSAISRSPEVVAAYTSDPLVHNRVNVRGALVILSAQTETLARAGDLHLPILMMHGSSDRIAAPSGSARFYEAAQAADKTLKIYDGLYHEVFNEPEQAQVLTDLIAWLDERL